MTKIYNFVAEKEQKKIIDYYEKMIDDRIEDGMSTECAIDGLGNLETSSTSFGDNNLPQTTTTGNKLLKVKTTHGNIDIKFEK